MTADRIDAVAQALRTITYYSAAGVADQADKDGFCWIKVTDLRAALDALAAQHAETPSVNEQGNYADHLIAHLRAADAVRSRVYDAARRSVLTHTAEVIADDVMDVVRPIVERADDYDTAQMLREARRQIEEWRTRSLAAEERARTAKAEVADFRAECDRVGVPYDAAGLVRHHRNGADHVAGVWKRNHDTVKAQRDAARAEATALGERIALAIERDCYAERHVLLDDGVCRYCARAARIARGTP